MSNTQWLNETVTRRSVAPTHGLGMGGVCLQVVGYTTGFAAGSVAVMSKRHLDAIPATPATGRTPWSPPVT